MHALSENDRYSLDMSTLTREEIDKTVSLLKNNTAPGPDGIPFSFWKKFPHTSTLVLHTVRDICNGNITSLPHSVSESLLILINKKGIKHTLDCKRPIFLQNTFTKIISHTLRARLQKVAIKICGDNQYGFLPGQQSATAICEILRFIKERKGYLLFVDVYKAYDSVNTGILLLLLHSLGFPDSFIRICKTLFATSQVRFCEATHIGKKTFDIANGVKQGDPSSCIFFDVVFSIVTRGVPDAVFFADDTTLKCLTWESFLHSNKLLLELLTLIQLKLNPDKTLLLPLEPIPSSAVIPYKTVSSVVHLGVLCGPAVSPDEMYESKVKAIEAFAMSFSARIKVDIFCAAKICNVFALSKLTHIAQQVPPSRNTVSRLEWCLRTILGQTATSTSLRKYYAGVPLHILCLPVQQGGVGILDPCTRLSALDVVWMNIFYFSKPPLPPLVLSHRLQLEHALSAATLSFCTPLIVNNTLPRKILAREIYHDIRAEKASHTMLPHFYNLWQNIQALKSSLLRQTAFLLFHQKLPCQEFLTRGWSVSTLNPCPYCSRYVPYGPTHLLTAGNRSCEGFAPVRLAIGMSEPFPLLATFLDLLATDLHCEAAISLIYVCYIMQKKPSTVKGFLWELSSFVHLPQVPVSSPSQTTMSALRTRLSLLSKDITRTRRLSAAAYVRGWYREPRFAAWVKRTINKNTRECIRNESLRMKEILRTKEIFQSNTPRGPGNATLYRFPLKAMGHRLPIASVARVSGGLSDGVKRVSSQPPHISCKTWCTTLSSQMTPPRPQIKCSVCSDTMFCSGSNFVGPLTQKAISFISKVNLLYFSYRQELQVTVQRFIDGLPGNYNIPLIGADQMRNRLEVTENTVRYARETEREKRERDEKERPREKNRQRVRDNEAGTDTLVATPIKRRKLTSSLLMYLTLGSYLSSPFIITYEPFTLPELLISYHNWALETSVERNEESERRERARRERVTTERAREGRTRDEHREHHGPTTSDQNFFSDSIAFINSFSFLDD
jgi:hypothetical protein